MRWRNEIKKEGKVTVNWRTDLGTMKRGEFKVPVSRTLISVDTLQRVARYVKGCPDTGIVFDWRTAPGIVQSDSDWAGDKSTRKSVSAGNTRCGQHLLRSWSKLLSR